MTKPYGGILQNWQIVGAGKGKQQVTGNLFQDPRHRWGAGTPIITSLLVEVDLTDNKIETLNTRYDLGIAYSKVTG